MHVLVVDDELLARQRAMRMIESLDDYEVVGEAGNGCRPGRDCRFRPGYSAA